MPTPLRRILVVIAVLVSLGWASLALPSPACAQPQPLGEPFQINTYTTGEHSKPAIAADADGNFVVVWQGDPAIRAQRFDTSGARLGAEIIVSQSSFPGGGAAQDVATYSDGQFVVVWTGVDGGIRQSAGIYGRRFDEAGDPVGGEFRVNSSTPNHQTKPAVVTIEGGGFVVAWHDTQGCYVCWRILGRRYDAMGAPLAQEFQVNDPAYSARGGPEIARDVSGGFVVVWTGGNDQDGDGEGIFGRRYDASGVLLGDEFQVNTFTTGNQEAPDIAAKDNGEFVVVWDRGLLLVSRRFDAQGNPVTGEIRAQFGGPSSHGEVAWLENDFVVTGNLGTPTPPSRLVGRHFSSYGQGVGGEFEVGFNAGENERYHEMASIGPREFVVAWHHGLTNGSSVWGQLFSIPAVTLTVDGSCPGPVTANISNAPPNSEIALIAAANTNGFIKGGALCNGTGLEIGEPFQLPPKFVIVDGNGNGSANLTLGTNRCHVQALALQSCETSNVAVVP